MQNQKTAQLQIRVSPAEKARIKNTARRANKTVSEWVLSQILNQSQSGVDEILKSLAKTASDQSTRHALAELNDFLYQMTGSEFKDLLGTKPQEIFTPYLNNLIAAMVEWAAHKKKVAPPAWTSEIAPLKTPFFSSPLKSLRSYLLTHSPPPFRRRNIFVDSSIGDRV